MTARGGLDVSGARVMFGSKPGLEDVTLQVARGERVALLGPSGAGKTSLLRAISGLGGLAGGTVHVDGRDVTTAPPERRAIVYMHQAPSLFPHLSVVDNVAFPLEVRGVPRRDALSKARALLEHVRLGPTALRQPSTLSGGQRHRAALARALAADPAVLLLDEPFSSLDPELRAEVREAVVDVLKSGGPAVLLVTHDVDEAAGLADRLIVLLDGRIAQNGPPAELLAAPRSVAVARFLGLPNLLRGSRSADGTVVCALGECRRPGVAGTVTVTVRASALSVHAPRGCGVAATVLGTLERVSGTTIRIALGGEQLQAVADRAAAFAVGASVEVDVDPMSLHVIDRRADER